MAKVKRIDPNSKEGLSSTYHSQADVGQIYGTGFNKWNWACVECGEVYLNRYKAEECYDSHHPKKDSFAESSEHIPNNEWCTCEECLPKFAECHNSPDGKHHFVGAAFTSKLCQYCLTVWNTGIHEKLVARGMAIRTWKFVGEK